MNSRELIDRAVDSDVENGISKVYTLKDDGTLVAAGSVRTQFMNDSGFKNPILIIGREDVPD